jgi:hypothetical protein
MTHDNASATTALTVYDTSWCPDWCCQPLPPRRPLSYGPGTRGSPSWTRAGAQSSCGRAWVVLSALVAAALALLATPARMPE